MVKKRGEMINIKKENAEFLVAYKTFENTLRETKSISVLDFEASHNQDEIAEKIKLCRILRNYLSHHEDGDTFITISSAMTFYLKERTSDLRKDQIKVGDVVKRQKTLLPSDTVKTAVALVAKYDFAPVVDNTGLFVGTVSPQMLVSAMARSKMATSTKMNEIIKVYNSNIIVADVDKPLKDYELGAFIVAVREGKYRGVVDWEKLWKG